MSNTDLTYTTYIHTTPEKLWQAITTPEFARQYWGGHVNVSEWKQDAKWQHEDTNNNNAVLLVGKVLEIIPPHRLVLSWASPSNEADLSTVTFEIQFVEGMVRLDVTHAGFNPDSSMRSSVSKGWPLVLSSMKTFLESGKPTDIMAILKKGCGTNKEAA